MFALGYTMTIQGGGLLTASLCLTVYKLYVTYTNELSGNIEHPKEFKELICKLSKI